MNRYGKTFLIYKCFDLFISLLKIHPKVKNDIIDRKSYICGFVLKIKYLSNNKDGVNVTNIANVANILNVELIIYFLKFSIIIIIHLPIYACKNTLIPYFSKSPLYESPRNTIVTEIFLFDKFIMLLINDSSRYVVIKTT
jgi:hypothetical protein